MKISIILPVYHEEKNILKVLKKIAKSVKTPNEILVIYDSASDPTFPVVKKYKKLHKEIQLIKNNTGSGRGVMNAIKTGFVSAKGEAIVVVMADLSDDISQIDTMYKYIQKGFSVVCASRFMKEGKKIGGTFLKNFLSKFADISLHFLLGIPTHDSTNAYKMYSKDFLHSITIESTGGFEYSLEITLKAFFSGEKITEIPTVWKDREAGKSNFQLRKWLPQYIKWYLWGLKEKFSLPVTYASYVFLSFFITLLYIGDQLKNKISLSSALDLSWQTDAVERLLHGYMAGKDYIFTYGPLFQIFDSLPALLFHVSSYLSVPLASLFSSILIALSVIFISSKVTNKKIDRYILPGFLLFILGIIPVLSDNSGIRLFVPFVYATLWIPMVFNKKFSVVRVIVLSLLPSIFGLYVYDLFPQTILLGCLFAFYIFIKGKEKILKRIIEFGLYILGIIIFQMLTSIIISGNLSYLQASLATLSDYYYVMNTAWEFGKTNYLFIFPIVMIAFLFIVQKGATVSSKIKVAAFVFTITAVMQLRTALIRSDSGHILSALLPSIIVTFILLYLLFTLKKVLSVLLFMLLFLLIPFNTSIYSVLSAENIKTIVHAISYRKSIAFEDIYVFPINYPIPAHVRREIFAFIAQHKGEIMLYPYDSILLNSQHTTYNTYALQLYDYSGSYVEERTVSELEKNSPKYIILEVDSRSTFALDNIPNFTRNPLIFKWMLTNYSVEKRVGDVLFLAHNVHKNSIVTSECKVLDIVGNFNSKSFLNATKPNLFYLISGGALRLPVKPSINDYLIIPEGSSTDALESLFNSSIDFSKKVEIPQIERNIKIVSVDFLSNVDFFTNFTVYCY